MSGKPSAGMYGAWWQKARKRHLAKHPLCAPCKRAGRTTAANTVDHITPHKGDLTLFRDENNWESQCPTCHSGDKHRQERSGIKAYRGASVDGTPLDPKHPWNGAA